MTLTPLTRPTACAASPSGLLAICSAVMLLTTLIEFFWVFRASLTEPRSDSAVTTCAVSCTLACASETSCWSVLPASR